MADLEDGTEGGRHAALMQVLTEILAELKRSNSVAREGAVSSVEIKFLANGEPQPVVKVYADSVPEVEVAVEAYARAVRLATEAKLRGWVT